MKRFLALLSCSLFLAVASISHAAAISVTAANVQPSGSAVYLPGDHYAISTITAGQAVYVSSSVVNPTPSTPDVAPASASGAGDAVKVIGIAVSGGGVGQPVKVVIRDPLFKIGGTCAAGDIIELHTTAGAITSTAADITSGQYVCVIGVGNGSGTINLGATQTNGVTSGSKWAGVIRADVAK